MAWGEWMVPQPGPEHLLNLEQQRRVIQQYKIEEARDMLWRLCQLSMHQDLILRSATKRIAELELSIELGVPLGAAIPAGAASEAESSETPDLEPEAVPWPIRVLRMVATLRAG